MGGDRKREIHTPYDTRQFFIFLEQVDTRRYTGIAWVLGSMLLDLRD